MWTVATFLLCSFVVVIAEDDLTFNADRPYLRVQVNSPAALECCHTSKQSLQSTWLVRFQKDNLSFPPHIVNLSDFVIVGNKTESGMFCGSLSFKSVKLSDTGLYLCHLNRTSQPQNLFSPGTYLQVYKPLEKTINLSENTKNKILTAEGILLFLCVLLPVTTLLWQSRRNNELERKKMKKEEENIYQGLNLDDCCTTYDQIERSQAHGPYQDVCNIAEEEEEIQLEKP